MSLQKLGQSKPSRRFNTSVSLISLSLIMSGGASAADADLRTIDQIPELMAAFDVDGLAVAAVKGDQVLVSVGYGVTQDGEPYKPTTSCGLFSATKTLASLTYANLAQDGRIDLNKPLGEYIEDAPDEWADIPFYRLLNHTSGITMIVNKPEFEDIISNPDAKNADIYQVVKGKPLDYQPGEYSRYRQSGYAVAEMVLKDQLDQDFGSLVDQYIIGPAGMTETSHPARTDDQQPAILLSAGGYQTTADDMARLFLGINDGSVINGDDWKALMLKDSYVVDGYSLGNVAELHDDFLTLGHRGGGVRANIRYAPDHQIGVMMCTDDRSNSGLGISLARMLVSEIATGEPPMTPLQMALAGFEAMTAAEVVAAYRAAAEQPDRYDLSSSEGILNVIGYTFLGADRFDDAIQIFKLNTEVFPNSANTFDSLGEALRAAGRIEDAIKSYEQVLKLRPDFPSAIKALDEMRAGS